MKTALLTLLLLMVSTFVFCQFIDIGSTLQGIFWGESEWGDYDNDGDLDLIVSGYISVNNYLTKIYRNDGAGVFTDINAALTPMQWSAISWGDYDRDGDLDFLISGSHTSTSYLTIIYRNDGNDTFTDINAGLPGVMDGDHAWGDYDNDGDLDFILSGMLYGQAHVNSIYRNDGNDIFTAVNNGFPLMRHPSFNWGDLDRDGDLDLAFCGYLSENNLITKIYRNDGNDVFTELNAGLLNLYNGCIRWADFDNDGYLDILLMGQYHQHPHQSTTKLYHNNGNSTFTEIPTGIIDVASGTTSMGDYDNDGDLDIALTGHIYSNETSTSRVYRNDGSFVFTHVATFIPAEGGTINWGDYDNDGDLDISLCGTMAGGFIVKLYRNDGTAVNTLPAAPSNLSATADENYVTFSWNPATDAQTPAAAMTYELRIGATPGGCDILSTLSAPNGYRRVPERGYINSTCSWKIKSSLFTQQNDYYWSVQAIDGGLAGSPFAPGAIYQNIKVIAPNGGESYPAGSVANIVWSASALIDSVRILFSADNGTSWNYVSEDAFPAQQGILPAETPYMVLPSCLIRVEKADDPSFYDDSDNTFALIENPPLPPDSVQIALQDDSAIVSWQPVTQTIHGTSFNPDYYIVFFNGTADVDGTYYYLGRTYSEDYVHDGVALHASNMYYHVRAFRRERSRTDDVILNSLTSRMTESEVLELLK